MEYMHESVKYMCDVSKDMLVQKAYGRLRARGYSYPISTCYYSLLGILEREGIAALEEYARTVRIAK